MTTTHTPRRLLLPEAPSDDFDFHTHNLMAPPGKAAGVFTTRSVTAPRNVYGAKGGDV